MRSPCSGSQWKSWGDLKNSIAWAPTTSSMAKGGVPGDCNMQQGGELLQQKPRLGCFVGAQEQLGSEMSLLKAP